MSAVSARDLESVLGFVHDARSPDEPRPFTTALVDHLTEVVGCEYGRYREIDLASRIEIAYVPCTAEMRDARCDDDEWTDRDWDDFFVWPCNRAVRSVRNGRFIYSELVSRGRVSARDARAWEADLRDEGCVDRMWVGIVGAPYAGFALDSGGRDFGDRDRLLSRVLQPHLTDLWRDGSIRRRLRAALSILDRDEREGVILTGSGTLVDFASPTARRFMRTYFGAAGARLPDAMADWLANGRRVPLVARADDRMLVVEAIRDGSALVLSEQAAAAMRLTPREREVMRCVTDGLSDAEIARRLWIEQATVRKHLEHVFGKIGVRSRTAAVAKLRSNSMGAVD